MGSIKDVKSSLTSLSNSMSDLKSENHDLKEAIVDLQCRSMRDNLMFHNIPEEKEDSVEDVEAKIHNLLSDKLHITDSKNVIKLDRAHRIGKRRFDAHKDRPIVVKFNSYKDRELVRNKASALRGHPEGISQQFPREVYERRKNLYPFFKEARGKGKKAVLVGDKLFINDRRFEPPLEPHSA